MLGSLGPAGAAVLFGDWVDRPRIPLLGLPPRRPREPRLGLVLPRVLDRPVVAPARRGALVVLALPTLSMNTRLLGDDDLPRSIPIMRATTPRRAFPEEGNAHAVVVRADDVRAPEVQAAARELVARAQASGAFVAGPSPTSSVAPTTRSSQIDLPYAGADGAIAARPHRFRHDLVPATVGRVARTRGRR